LDSTTCHSTAINNSITVVKSATIPRSRDIDAENVTRLLQNHLEITEFVKRG